MPGQYEQPCADYTLLVPLKRSRHYRAVRSRVADPRPSDAWQQDGLHFFVFDLGAVEVDASGTLEPPVAVFVMRPDVPEPISAVVVRLDPDGEPAETAPILEADSPSISPPS